MNTATITLRLTAGAAIVAAAVTLAGCASAASTANRVPISADVHRALVDSAAERYLSELQVRHDLATQSVHPSADRYVRELEVRHDLAMRSLHEAADRYEQQQLVRARVAADGDAPGWTGGR